MAQLMSPPRAERVESLAAFLAANQNLEKKILISSLLLLKIRCNVISKICNPILPEVNDPRVLVHVPVVVGPAVGGEGADGAGKLLGRSRLPVDVEGVRFKVLVGGIHLFALPTAVHDFPALHHDLPAHRLSFMSQANVHVPR